MNVRAVKRGIIHVSTDCWLTKVKNRILHRVGCTLCVCTTHPNISSSLQGPVQSVTPTKSAAGLQDYVWLTPKNVSQWLDPSCLQTPAINDADVPPASLSMLTSVLLQLKFSLFPAFVYGTNVFGSRSDHGRCSNVFFTALCCSYTWQPAAHTQQLL